MAEVNAPTITQGEYRVILEADMARALEKFQEFPDAEPREKWRCWKCGTPANVTIVAHPIWNGPFDGAGTGACDYRELPFCPICDGDRPQWESGAPIRIPLMPGEPVAIMRRLTDRIFRLGPHRIFLKTKE